MQKKILAMLLALVLCLGSALPAFAAEEETHWYPDSIVLQQSRRGTCTLCSSAMMVRARLYNDNFLDWDSADEESVSHYAWCSAGLLWSWSYPTADGDLTVAHASVSGISADDLRALLDEHPEGIVLYCGNWPHAVWLIRYCDDGTFTCADPAFGTVSALADSCLGSYGSQDAVLQHVTAYWYIEN